MRTRPFLMMLMMFLFAAAITPAAAQGPRKHVDVTCLPNQPPGEPTLIAVSEFDLPKERAAFLAYGALCRSIGGHVVQIRNFH